MMRHTASQQSIPHNLLNDAPEITRVNTQLENPNHHANAQIINNQMIRNGTSQEFFAGQGGTNESDIRSQATGFSKAIVDHYSNI